MDDVPVVDDMAAFVGRRLSAHSGDLDQSECLIGISEATGIGRTAVTITYFPDRILMQTRRINGVPGRDGACAVA